MERYDGRSDLQYGVQRFSELIKLGNISKNPTSQLGCTYHAGGITDNLCRHTWILYRSYTGD